MSEPITEMDIKNWREYYSEIPEYEMLGRDLFAISCMDTIDALRAELGMKNDALESYAEFYDQAAAACGLTDANPGSATDEIILTRLYKYDQLRADLDRERAELKQARESYVASETRADDAEAERGILEAQTNVLAAGFLVLIDKHLGETCGEVESAALTIAQKFAPWKARSALLAGKDGKK